METKLILLDLDYTLLKNDKTISQKSIKVLNACQKQGIKIGFSTSRGNTNIQQYVDLVNPDIIICNGGANIYSNGKLLHSQGFTLEQTRQIFAAAYKESGENIEMTCDTEHELYWNRTENKTNQFTNDTEFDDFLDFKLSALKICIQTTNQELIERIIKTSNVQDCKAIPFSDIPWYKIAPTKATKENAIHFVASFFNIPTSKMISFGDDYSDIGMLKLCGKGIAMGNAIEEVKQVASDITLTNDEDGVAIYLEKNILKNETDK